MTSPNPDPLRPRETDRYVVEPILVDPDADEINSGGVIVWIGVALVLVVTLAILALIIYGTAPRSAPDASVSPRALTSTGAPRVPPFLLPAAASVPSEEPAAFPGIGSVPAQARGWATWYNAPTAQDAAAGPALRAAIGAGWRGAWVRVSHVDDGTVATVNVRLTDWCACGDRHGRDTVIDLDDQAFHELAPLGAGVIRVTVERIDGVPLPPTDGAS